MKPLLIVFAGKPATGKTTLARIIATEEGITYLDYDTLVQPFLEHIEKAYGLGGTDRYGFYRMWRECCYTTVMDVVLENIRLGNSVILTAPFSRELKDPDYPSHLREMAGCSFSLLLCYMAPPLSQHLQMMRLRSSHRDEDFLNNEERFAHVCGPESPLWGEDVCMVLDSGDLQRNKQLVRARVATLKERSI
jgi:gluconate kinase